MSVKTPLNPTLTLKGIDLKVQDIRPSFSWLEKSFGLADRIVEKEGYTYPAVFESNQIDPISMMPCDAWKSFCFWVKDNKASVDNNIDFPPRNPIVTYKVACIFYMDIKRIDTGIYKETKTQIREDIFNYFNKVKLAGQLVLTEVVEDDLTKIYEGFSLEQVDNKFKMYPKWAIRFNFELSYRDTCYSTNTYSTT